MAIQEAGSSRRASSRTAPPRSARTFGAARYGRAPSSRRTKTRRRRALGDPGIAPAAQIGFTALAQKETAMRIFGLVSIRALVFGTACLAASMAGAQATRAFSFAYDQPTTTAYGIAANLFDAKL